MMLHSPQMILSFLSIIFLLATCTDKLGKQDLFKVSAD